MKTKLLLVISFLSASLTYGQTLTTVANPSLFDNGGKFMGHIMSGDPTQLYLMFRLNGSETIILKVERFGPVMGGMQGPLSGQLKWTKGILYYPTTDCTGPGFIPAPNITTVVDRLAAVGPGNILYVNRAVGTQSATIRAFFNGGCHPFGDMALVNLYPADPAVNLDTLFTEPFKTADGPSQAPSQAQAPALGMKTLLLLALSLGAAGLWFTRMK
jgi:hypothetical protein